MGWSDYKTKEQIMSALRSMDPIAADAARYLADLLLEHRDRLGDAETVSELAYAAMAKALRDANLSPPPTHAHVLYLAATYGPMIGDLAIAMAVFLSEKKQSGWIVGSVAVGLGVAIAALGG